MTDTDEIDRRRAEIIFSRVDPESAWIWKGLGEVAQRVFLDHARAIRESDEAAGYELVKRVEHRGVIT